MGWGGVCEEESSWRVLERSSVLRGGEWVVARVAVVSVVVDVRVCVVGLLERGV